MNTNKEFDEDKVVYEVEHSSYQIKYFVYKGGTDYNGLTTEKDVKNSKHIKKSEVVCFSQLPYMLSEFFGIHDEWPNKLLFICDFEKHNASKYHTSYGERCWWISHCKKHKLLPNYIDNNFAKSGNLILRIDELDLNTLYIYLSVTRHLQEEPFFIKAIKYLTEYKNMDFYVAFAVASRCCICNTGHHIIPVGKTYPHDDQNNNVNFIDRYQLCDVIRLKEFLDKESHVNDVLIKDMKIGESLTRFNLHKRLQEIRCGKRTVVKSNDLTLKDTVEKIYR